MVKVKFRKPYAGAVTVCICNDDSNTTLCGFDVTQDAFRREATGPVTCKECAAKVYNATEYTNKPLKSLGEIEINRKIDGDPVNKPPHYTTGKIECIDFIEDKKLNFNRGNAVKYIVRAGRKDPAKEIEDLEKAVWYLNREIQLLKNS